MVEPINCWNKPRISCTDWKPFLTRLKLSSRGTWTKLPRSWAAWASPMTKNAWYCKPWAFVLGIGTNAPMDTFTASRVSPRAFSLDWFWKFWLVIILRRVWRCYASWEVQRVRREHRWSEPQAARDERGCYGDGRRHAWRMDQSPEYGKAAPFLSRRDAGLLFLLCFHVCLFDEWHVLTVR